MTSSRILSSSLNSGFLAQGLPEIFCPSDARSIRREDVVFRNKSGKGKGARCWSACQLMGTGWRTLKDCRGQYRLMTVNPDFLTPSATAESENGAGRPRGSLAGLGQCGQQGLPVVAGSFWLEISQSWWCNAVADSQGAPSSFGICLPS